MPQWFSVGSSFEQWSLILSIISLVLTVVGFVVIGCSSFYAMRAAEAAKKAAEEAKKQVFLLDVVAESMEALAKVGEIKRLQNDKEWRYLPEKYTELIKKLVVVRKYMESSLTDAQKTVLRSAFSDFKTLQKKIEKKIEKEDFPITVSDINSILSKQEILLHGLFIEIKIGKQ